ncbi:hypothetical protein DFH94DRAFT_220218 [Russula ochroleuca]|uniref:Fungal STAND N-terminal Goodbye domain-containing protein n=1 Tax=Russula ochroleuca TaxID=152965 RepID=A0A9P5MM41_9AGAM|nr:hypothetical protein DFH94DRAFT_220218 [Russula ochroleuca]
MPQTSLEAASRSNYQLIFDSALEAYKKKTGKDLPKDPLFRRFENCQSPDAVITILRAQIRGPGNRSDKLTTWLDPTVNVINAFSAAIGGVGLAYPPAGVIFTGIGILLSAVKGVSASRGPLVDLFTRIENIFRRLEIYIGLPLTAGMTDSIVGVMVEVLCVLAIATKESKQNRAKIFTKKLLGRRDMENALQRLENMTLEETRMIGAEALKAIHGVEGVLQGVTDLLHGVRDKVRDLGDSDKVIDGAQTIQLAMSTALTVYGQVTRRPDDRQKMWSVKEQ